MASAVVCAGAALSETASVVSTGSVLRDVLALEVPRGHRKTRLSKRATAAVRVQSLVAQAVLLVVIA